MYRSEFLSVTAVRLSTLRVVLVGAIWVPTHLPTHLQYMLQPTATHLREVVPDVVPCASRIFKVFYKAFFATFGGVLSRKIGGKGPENVDLEQFLCV